MIEDLFEKQNISKILTTYYNLQNYFATAKFIVWKNKRLYGTDVNLYKSNNNHTPNRPFQTKKDLWKFKCNFKSLPPAIESKGNTEHEW